MSGPRLETAAKAIMDDNPFNDEAGLWEVPSIKAHYMAIARAALTAADAVDPLRQERTVTTLDELEELPVGSIIADFGMGGVLMDSPVIACKTAHGDWQVMGGPPERRWRSASVLEGAAGVPLTVLSNPAA